MLAFRLAAGLCQVYVITSLLGPTEREALILASKFIRMIYRICAGHGSDHLAKLADAMNMA